MKAILKNEIIGYFLSPIAYVFIGVFVMINSFLFVNGPLAYGIADVKSLFSNINVIFLFLVSMLTMRLLSEEKNKKTEQLLLTAPVSTWEIILAKYFAAMTIFLTALAISFVLPLILFIYGQPSVAECIGGYIGFLLLWGALVAVGLFISGLTENQIVSAIITFAVLMFINYIDYFASSVTNELMRDIILSFSLFNHYSSFVAGVLDFNDIIYFVSFIVAFLFLTERMTESRRYF